MPSGNSTQSAFWSHQTATWGAGNEGSANAPTGTPMTSGMASSSVQTVDPHVGQNDSVTRPPEAPSRSKRVTSPVRSTTCASGQRDATTNTLPDRRWHQVQLHADTMAGSPATVTRTRPHWHWAVRVLAPASVS